MLPQVKKLSRRVGMEKAVSKVPSGNGLGLNQKNRAGARRLLYSLAMSGHIGHCVNYYTPTPHLLQAGMNAQGIEKIAHGCWEPNTSRKWCSNGGSLKHKSGRQFIEGLVTLSNTNRLSRCHNVVGPGLLGKMFRQFQLLGAVLDQR